MLGQELVWHLYHMIAFGISILHVLAGLIGLTIAAYIVLVVTLYGIGLPIMLIAWCMGSLSEWLRRRRCFLAR